MDKIKCNIKEGKDLYSVQFNHAECIRRLTNYMNELVEEYNEHRKEYTAVLDRIEDILDRLRQLGG